AAPWLATSRAISGCELSFRSTKMHPTDGQSSHRSSARLSRFPKSVACIIATSGRRPDPAQSVRHARARPSVRLLRRPTLSSAAFVRGSGWAQSGWLAFLRPVVYSLLTFLGPSGQHGPSSTEWDEVLAKDNPPSAPGGSGGRGHSAGRRASSGGPRA